jgi:hypothetical protein
MNDAFYCWCRCGLVLGPARLIFLSCNDTWASVCKQCSKQLHFPVVNNRPSEGLPPDDGIGIQLVTLLSSFKAISVTFQLSDIQTVFVLDVTSWLGLDVCSIVLMCRQSRCSYSRIVRGHQVQCCNFIPEKLFSHKLCWAGKKLFFRFHSSEFMHFDPVLPLQSRSCINLHLHIN